MLASTQNLLDAKIMHPNYLVAFETPRFFREPSADDIERMGLDVANVSARLRARLINCRILAGSTVLGIGLTKTATEVLVDSTSPAKVFFNFLVPAIVNGAWEAKLERQLRHTSAEAIELLSVMPDPPALLPPEAGEPQ